jgi:glycosyltransferase involved in cell wall biosynthesis
VQQAGAGLVEDDTVDGTRALLQRWVHMDGAEREAMGRQARQLFDDRFTVNAMAESLLQVVPAVQQSTV